MIGLRFIPLVLKQIIRHRVRTLLTIGGVATAMFLFASVQAMQQGVRDATEITARDTTLIVYRQNRFCPATSRLPEYYGERIAKLPHVTSVIPMKIVVNNCRTSLDVVTFRGVPEDDFLSVHAPGFVLLEGSLRDWQSRSDAALLGETLARRRGLRAGDRFDAAGVTVYVAGVFRSDQPQDQNVGYVHLNFLQQTAGQRTLGVVTQFNVKVDDPLRLEQVAQAIDAEFAAAHEPTHTSAEKAFVARAAQEVIGVVRFTRWVGFGCLAAVLALVGNAIVLSVQDRIREHAILQTLGFSEVRIAALIILEGLTLGLIGGAIGTAAAMAVARWGHLSLSSEGLSIHMRAGLEVALVGLLIAALLGALASVVPAVQAARREITTCFRAV